MGRAILPARAGEAARVTSTDHIVPKAILPFETKSGKDTSMPPAFPELQAGLPSALTL